MAPRGFVTRAARGNRKGAYVGREADHRAESCAAALAAGGEQAHTRAHTFGARTEPVISLHCGPPRACELPAMSDAGTTLPSVSSLLQWARGAAEHERAPEQPPAPAKRTFSSLSAADADGIPAPLTADIIQRATEELPQGAGVALESCLTAFKVVALLPAPLRCARHAATRTRICFRPLACYVRVHTDIHMRWVGTRDRASRTTVRPRAADTRPCCARPSHCLRSPSDCPRQSFSPLRGRSCGKALRSLQRSKRA